MGFTEEFFLTAKSYGGLSTEARSLIRSEKHLEAIPSLLQRSLTQQARSISESQARSAESQTRWAEMVTREFGRATEVVAERVQECMARSTDAVAEMTQQLCEYLGWGFSEIHWLLERQTKIGKQVLDALLNSLDGQSKQYWQQGVRCYEVGEYGLAKERFQKALESNRTNFFAYQYLAFIGVLTGDPREALRNFELAGKFAENDYYRVAALSRLARCHWAQGSMDSAVQYMRTATELQPESARLHFDYAVLLAAAASKWHGAAPYALRQAITLDPTYWSLGAVEVGLEPIRSKVNALLEEMVSEARTKAKEALSGFAELIPKARATAPEYVVREFETSHRNLDSMVATAGFTELLQMLATANGAMKALDEAIVTSLRQRLSGIRVR